jgi:hypothetical protein
VEVLELELLRLQRKWEGTQETLRGVVRKSASLAILPDDEDTPVETEETAATVEIDHLKDCSCVSIQSFQVQNQDLRISLAREPSPVTCFGGCFLKIV